MRVLFLLRECRPTDALTHLLLVTGLMCAVLAGLMPGDDTSISLGGGYLCKYIKHK